jgi:hypothetical protein
LPAVALDPFALPPAVAPPPSPLVPVPVPVLVLVPVPPAIVPAVSSKTPVAHAPKPEATKASQTNDDRTMRRYDGARFRAQPPTRQSSRFRAEFRAFSRRGVT